MIDKIEMVSAFLKEDLKPLVLDIEVNAFKEFVGNLLKEVDLKDRYTRRTLEFLLERAEDILKDNEEDHGRAPLLSSDVTYALKTRIIDAGLNACRKMSPEGFKPPPSNNIMQYDYVSDKKPIPDETLVNHEMSKLASIFKKPELDPDSDEPRKFTVL